MIYYIDKLRSRVKFEKVIFINLENKSILCIYKNFLAFQSFFSTHPQCAVILQVYIYLHKYFNNQNLPSAQHSRHRLLIITI